MIALTIGGLIVSATACAEDEGDDLPHPAPPPPAGALPPTTSLDPKDAAAAEEILAAFDGYMEALIELSTEGVPGGTGETLARLEDVHVGGEVHDELAFDLLNANYLAGRATAGTVTWNAALLEIDWNHRFDQRPDEPVPLATLRVCYDETRWTMIDKATGEAVDGPGKRYLSTVTVTWRGEDPDRPDREPRWQVAFREDSSEPC
jgi:hypothetical protein